MIVHELPARPRPRAIPSKAFALTACLITLVLLTVMIVAYLSAVRTDRSTSSTFADIQRVNLLADGALSVALGRTLEAISAVAYHAEGYREESVPSEDGMRTLTVPVVVQKSPVPEKDARIVYLISTPVPDVFPDSISFDAMADLDPDRTLGFTTTGSHDYRAPWLTVTQDPAAPPDPSRNPVVGRYAFWVEDETAKLDYGVSGNDYAGGAFLRGDGIPPIDIDLGALPLLHFDPLTDDPDSTQINRDIIVTRVRLPFVEPRFLNRASPLLDPQVFDDIVRFHGTVFSKSNDLSAHGTRRANLNALVQNSDEPVAVRRQLDDIKRVIQNGIPGFGRRLFPAQSDAAGAGNASYQDIYLTKIAANIRDYIDSDSQPTIVAKDGSVLPSPVADSRWPGDGPPLAIGKEAAPYLTEYAWVGHENSWERRGRTATFEISIDQYFEFVNPTTLPVTLPGGSSLRVTNRPSWDTGTEGKITLPDLTIDLSGVTFPPGSAVVVTTDPNPLELPDGVLQPGALVVSIPTDDTDRILSGRTDRIENGVPVVAPDLVDRAAGPAVLTWSSDRGTYDLYPFLAAGDAAHPVFTFDGSFPGQAGLHRVYAASLAGNVSNTDTVRTGDPRSLSEPLAYSTPSATAAAFSATGYVGFFPGRSTIGRFKSPLVDPTRWPDLASVFDDTAISAPAFIANKSLVSIGQLGDVYDPSREAKGPLELASGGGRTLAVGQPESGAGSKFSASWMRSAWRLTDFFDASPDKGVATPATSRGRINVNGVLRDNGVALRGVLRGLTFGDEPRTQKPFVRHLLTSDEIDQFIESLKDYILEHGPLMERGELSEISFFDRERTSVAGTAWKAVDDRTREELFRRIVELITTRSASFTIHVVAETVHQKPDGSLVPRSRSRRDVVYSLEPRIGTGLDDQIQSFEARAVFAYPNR